MENTFNITDSNDEMELQYDSFIECSRENLEKDIKSSELFINLLLIIDITPNLKFTALGIKNYIAFKTKDNQTLLRIMKIFLKSKNLLKSDNCNTYVRVFFRAGLILMETKKQYLSAYCFQNALNVIERNLADNSKDCYDTIEKKMKDISKEILFELNKQSKSYLEYESKLVEFKSNWNKILNLKIEENNVFYIVSSAWIENLMRFIDNKDQMKFDITSVFSQYFSDDKKELSSGVYPGPINNYHLISFSDIWYDPEINYLDSNLPLKKNLKENSDYFILDKINYDFLKNLFGCYFEIPRKPIKSNDEILLEVHYFKLKILVISDLIKSDYKNFLNPKRICISRVETIKSLKEKVLRSLNLIITTINYSLETHEMQLILPNLIDKKMDLFKIVFKISCGSELVEVEGEYIENDSLSLQESKIPNNTLIIIEIKEKSKENFTVKLKENDKKCMKCQTKIKTNKFNCQTCNKYFYCSEECRGEDVSHRNYHSNLEKLYFKKIDMKHIASIKLTEILEKNSKMGLTGLRNLGNTCFMNSAIQCLSHSEDLTKYFLLKCNELEINTQSTHGTKGQMAKAYCELINELWNGSNNYLSPWDFRQIFVRFAKQFSGFSQHDSHEMLTFVLDGLHEDLNRVKSKPYLELTEKLPNETEIQAASRWWDVHIKRENSIIVDLFHGQYKSTITCPECKQVSLTYDPFMHLGLPIPTPVSSAIIKIKYFLIQSYKYKYIEADVNDSTTVNEIKKKIQEAEKIIKFWLPIYVSKKNDIKFKKVLKDNDLILKKYKQSHEIVYYQINSPFEDLEVFTFVTPSILVKENKYFLFTQYTNKPIFYPRPFFFNKYSTIKDLYFEVFKYFRPFIQNINNEKYEENIKEKTFIENEFNVFFDNPKNYPFKLFFKNNKINKASWYYFNDVCEFCGKNCIECELSYGLEIKLTDITNKLKDERELQLNCLLKTPDTVNKYYFQSYLYEILLKANLNFTHNSLDKEIITFQKSANRNLTLYDCLESFRKEERLEKENSWYCPNCKNHQEAFKKMEIYRTPKVLIVQLKRFKMKESNSYFSSSFQNKKNDCFIEYPLELDLNPFICGPENKNYKYKLFAISQHFGSISSGHYTALCKNRGKWYSFDDESVSRADEKEIFSKSAYLLFYGINV